MSKTPTPRHGAPESRKRRKNAPQGVVPATHLSSRSARVTQMSQPRYRQQRQQARRGSSRGPWPYVVGVVLAVVVLGFFALSVMPHLMSAIRGTGDDTTVAQGTEVTVEVPEGAGGQTIFQSLVSAGLLNSNQSNDFLQEVKRQGAESSLQAGTYHFVAGTSVEDLVKDLMAGPDTTSAYKLTIPEGYTVAKTAAAVQEAIPSISADDFVAQAKASNYVADYPFLSGVADDSLEGYLFPKTYNFDEGATADTVIRAMLDQYRREVAQLDFATAEANIASRWGITLDDYQIMTVASIIEREAFQDDDRPVVASVFYNRLQAGMPLQSDATTEYEVGRQVTQDDLKVQSPYNTYLNEGLTPTPICSPGLPSIQAALNPTDTDYLYFYLVEDGDRHVSTFARTYDEHLANIAANSADGGTAAGTDTVE